MMLGEIRLVGLVFIYSWEVCASAKSGMDINPDDVFDVYHLTHLIDGHEWISMSADFFHSGVGFKKQNTWFWDEMYVAEYWANSLNTDTVIPTLENGQEVFNNLVTVDIGPVSSFSEWTHAQKAGSVSGWVLTQYYDWISSWMNECPMYTLWAVADSFELTDRTNVMLRECDCHRFAEDSLNWLHMKGGRFTNQQPFCKNIFILLTHDYPQRVSMYDTSMQAFYRKFRLIFSEFSLSEVVSEFFSWIADRSAPYFYVFKGVMNEPGEFYYVSLSSQFTQMPSYSSQKMILNWQDNSRAVFCSFAEYSNKTAEMSRALIV